MSARDITKFGTPPESDVTPVLAFHFVACVCALALLRPAFVLDGTHVRWSLVVVLSGCLTYLVIPPANTRIMHDTLERFRGSLLGALDVRT